ncbi:hypothetical protein M8C21_028479 [Ambrosia artemisiifolia]|uniref:WAT1-related protein n=1 Tax=Ambrosia artemisiifolia TaxID=4212 RepID=A0AAD5DC59_AMBAR|nr:hypothetical protein M8C21_028479 [Ambrosia artemisiifolia]
MDKCRICLAQVLLYVGVDHTSPIMATTIANLCPAITFLISVFCRLEKMDTTISSVAKLSGTIIAILGAILSRPGIFHTNSPNRLLLSQPSEWIFGSLVILTAITFGCIWIVLMCIALSPFLERNRSAWVLQPRTGLTAVVLGAVCHTVVRGSVYTWCLRKKGPIFAVMFSPFSIVIAMIIGVTFLGDHFI